MMKVIGIPCCYYPTTALLIDDDQNYLNILKDSVDTRHKAFSDPHDAVQFLEHAAFSALKQNSITGEIDIETIREQLDNPKRIDEISVVIVDYQMPGMNGIDFCRKIRSKHFKIIMLTGEATHALAVDAFNDGIIDRFIQKSTPHLHRELSKTIAEMQFKHFQDVSIYLLNQFSKRHEPLPWFLQNEAFCEFFMPLLQKNQISEYAILNALGDFIIKTETGSTRYLTIRNEASLNMELKLDIEPLYLEEPSSEAETIYTAIKTKAKIPFVWNQAELTPLKDWTLYPMQQGVSQDQTFYYALI
jgi:CheY-like chemotaxis protein